LETFSFQNNFRLHFSYKTIIYNFKYCCCFRIYYLLIVFHQILCTFFVFLFLYVIKVLERTFYYDFTNQTVTGQFFWPVLPCALFYFALPGPVLNAWLFLLPCPALRAGRNQGFYIDYMSENKTDNLRAFPRSLSFQSSIRYLVISKEYYEI